MKPKSYSILLDIYKGVLNNNQLIEFTTGDNGQSVLEFVLLEDKITAYNLDGCMVRMVIEGQQQDCTIVDASNGKVKIVLLQSMFSRPGNVMAEIQIYDSSDQTLRLTTPRFQYNVRKSLMNNTTVQADPNYSILQNMILEVSSADEVAKQAKKTAESAMTTANQAESKANQIIDNGNYAKEQGDYAKAEGDRLQGMLTIDGTAQTKFDFIKNKVVQDGLVNLVIDKGGVTSNVEFKQDKEFSISVYAQHSVGTSGNKNIVGVQSVYQQYGWFLAMKGDTGNIQLISNTDGKEMSVMVGNVSDGAFHRYDLIYKNHKIAISIDGVFMGIYDLIFTDGGDKRIKTGANSQGQPLNMYKYFYIYDRELFSQEIERNFSFLNNVPSIKELHTTDSTGKTSILKLASDTDHVEDRSGRTQEQINRTFYKRMCKEIPSPSGEPITVKNGEEGYVLSAEIKGNTQLFKRAKGSQDEWIVIPNDEGRDTVAFEYKLDSTQAIISNNGEPYPIYANEEDKANKKVISLGGVGDVKDTLEILEDGSAIYMQRNAKHVVDGSRSFGMSSQNETLIGIGSLLPTGTFKADLNNIRIISDKIKCKKGTDCKPNAWSITSGDVSDESYIAVWDNGHVMAVLQKSVYGNNIDEVKSYLNTNPLTIIGQLATPIITHIPKELVQAILTHNKTNILEAGGAVKPSSFKVTVPVDKLAEIEARLQALESTTVDVVLNK